MASGSHDFFHLDQAQYIDWRCWTAIFLAGTSPWDVAKHEDPWVREAARVMVPYGEDWTVRGPTAVQKAILMAFRFQRRDTLLRAIVESSLLAQLSPPEIAARWHFPEPMLTAFQALFFDVQGPERVSLWAAHTAANPSMDAISASLGDALRTHAARCGREDLETALSVILRCTGESMLAGLPSSQSPRPIREFLTCLILAGSLLSCHPEAEVLRQRITKATCEGLFQKDWDPSYDHVVLEFLAAAKIPAAVRKEIAKLRRRIGLGPIDSDSSPTTILKAAADGVT
jgi:hypothetical protein